jgi:enamine deaminase RidA (YjgF/YER057c/UK114 family)
MERRTINPWTWQDEFDFSQAIEIRGTDRVVYLAGQMSVDEEGRLLHEGDMVAQFNQALDNLERVLAAAGLALADVVRLNYYVTDVAAFLEAVPQVGPRLRAASCKPTSTLLGIERLAQPGGLIEIEATAAG